jgi:hypothetical protein
MKKISKKSKRKAAPGRVLVAAEHHVEEVTWRDQFEVVADDLDEDASEALVDVKNIEANYSASDEYAAVYSLQKLLAKIHETAAWMRMFARTNPDGGHGAPPASKAQPREGNGNSIH